MGYSQSMCLTAISGGLLYYVLGCFVVAAVIVIIVVVHRYHRWVVIWLYLFCESLHGDFWYH